MSRGLLRLFAALSLTLLSLVAPSCRLPLEYNVKPGTAPRCADGLCVEVVAFRALQPTVGMWIEAPPPTWLVNASFGVDDDPPCRGHLPVEWVTVDEATVNFGPAEIGGAHGLLLGFPSNAWFGHSGYWRDTFVDLQLDVAGQRRCVRTRLTRGADGRAAVGL